VGQRHGLGLSAGARLYVTRIDAAANRIVVGEADALLAERARLENVSWIAGEPPEEAVQARVRVRHRHQGVRATIEPDGKDGARVQFLEPVRAVAPGQAAVFYQGDRVLGGGWIARESA
jgi:tRNA-specific 2-thiouridylase